MSEKEIYARIVEVIQGREGAGFSVSPELSLKDELGVDSVDLMEFIINLEDTFEIEIPDEQIDQFQNVSDIVTFIHSKVK